MGITFISPDYESTNRMIEVAENFNLKVNVIDPSNASSMGINPFSYGVASEIAATISSILTNMYAFGKPAEEEIYFQNSALQAVENITILLCEMYPRLHGGLLPCLEDILDILNDFNIAVDMCEKLQEDEELAKTYKLQIGYFKKYFYPNSVMRNETEKYVHTAITQLDGLLRIPGLRNILCNRVNNVNFDEALENGDVTIVCTRRGDLGSKLQSAFGLFFLLAMQRSVIKRAGSEQSRIPHILYVDDSAEYLSPATIGMFTLYRKYKVGTIATIQNLEQLDITPSSRRTILSNCTAKIVFGNLTPAENEFWSNEFGDKREWLYSQDMSIKGEGSGDQFWGGEGTAKSVSYGDFKGVKWGWKKNFELGKIQALKFKNCAFKYKDDKGKSFVGVATLDFMGSKYKEKQKAKKFDFEKYQSNHITQPMSHNSRFKAKQVDFDNLPDDEEVDPIQTDITDAGALFNNEDAIVYNIGKKHS